ncbi:MAG: phosphate acyltransferase PlsX [Myxococcota bacterium]|nr:phosphate acyltransferase PlsX [Myxococcota bacterium]
MTTIAVDAMGGYHPDAVLAAVAEASMFRDEHSEQPVFFSLVGDERTLTSKLSGLSHNPERINVVHAPDHVGMAESPQRAFENHPLNATTVACELVAQGHADAVVSAGNPGLAVLSAREHFTLIEGIKRAALASVYPTPRRRGENQDRFSLLLDVGASIHASPEELVSFAIMGSSYARIVSRNENPRVALLSNSREGAMGPTSVVKAHALLQERRDINFIGNIEGHDIPHGNADVIVCEGFVGDVVIKILEGVGEAAMELARSAYERKFVYRQGLRLLSGGLKKIKQVIDFEEYGGAPLLGYEHLMILAHPRSQQRAIHNALRLTIKSAREELAGDMRARLEQGSA